MIVLDAPTPVAALRRQPNRRFVIRRGHLIAETTTETRWHEPQLRKQSDGEG
jgi:hypothetical protein